MLQSGSAAGVAYRDDLQLRMHVLRKLCGGAPRVYLSQLRWRACATTGAPRGCTESISSQPRSHVQATRVRHLSRMSFASLRAYLVQASRLADHTVASKRGAAHTLLGRAGLRLVRPGTVVVRPRRRCLGWTAAP